MKVEVNTHKFEWAHGKKPRGEGAWAFEVDGTVFWFEGMFRTACECARRKAEEKKVHVVTVCS